ncbi:hypothetical protein GIB67_023984 [Kingdonia uniflora]|uniref:CWF19-like protein 2 n=1 Tax=Kingdonia uniflora TaxID=39325 RepID=A0A7J7LPQ2_9MAGN|nr:hypothetical protein GIB67_023984 [Kingdonia uniflora]
MLSGVKFIPRDQVKIDLEPLTKERKGLSRKDGDKRKVKNLSYCSLDEDTALSLKKRSKKWYSSDEHSSELSGSGTEDSEYEEKGRHASRGKSKKSRKENDKVKSKSKRKKKSYSSESESESEDESRRGSREDGSDQKKGGKSRREERGDTSDDVRGSISQVDKEQARKEAGLEWMSKPTNSSASFFANNNDKLEPETEEVKEHNPKELNPYFKDNNSEYPEDIGEAKSGVNRLPSSSVIGDGGASWRRKALKRAQEQAAREGKKLNEVVGERWGSLGQLTVSAAFCAAPAHAHLHAIRDRKRGATEKHETLLDDPNNKNNDKSNGGSREYLRDVSLRHPEMKVPRVCDSLSWKKKKDQSIQAEDTQFISAAGSCLNQFVNDGSFMDQTKVANSSYKHKGTDDMNVNVVSQDSEQSSSIRQSLTANQLAAKVLQLRMKGKHEEAEKLLKQADTINTKQESELQLASLRAERGSSRYAMQDVSAQQRKKEDGADMHLARTIGQNKQYSLSSRADDEYDFEGASSKKQIRKSRGAAEQLTDKSNFAKHISTQQERCQFCFENPTRPRHLVISIANFTYLMLPQWQPVVQGHCCIVPMQHESATRKVDNGVWEEIRNFKKRLINMFAEQEKDVIFLETVVGLAQQRRHCLVECIPLPHEIARQGPLYFKKAIDESEGEWSQHNAKKLIDTSQKGLRGSIPENFPYFHVEFGLYKGFVHVIDDEKKFESSFGLNVIRGMLRLPEEDMHRRRRNESTETQKQAVATFVRQWDPYDWTKRLS